MTPCRLIIDPPLDGAWNMAIDEALLEDAAAHGTATLRFYQWAEPTLSLGYFQPYQQRQAHAASRSAAVVRRSSGGGALVHDRELTYSLALPAAHPLARESSRLYRVAHETLIATLDEWQVAPAIFGDDAVSAVSHADISGRASSPDADSAEPFLCFARRTDADVILADPRASASASKICGSAQRRRRGAVLQHGGVLLDRSPAAPELPGIQQLGAGRIAPDELIRQWQSRLAAALELQPFEQPLPAELIELARQLYREKYSDRSWTERR